MEIKTLAQILAEHPDNHQGSPKKNEQSQSQNQSQSQAHQIPRAQTSSARGVAVSKNKHSKTKHTINPDAPDTPDTLKTNHTVMTQRSFAESQDSQDSQDSHGDDDSSGENRYYQKKSNPKNKTAKKKKSFHPASPYQPKLANTPPIAEIDANRLKNILAQIKAEPGQRPADSQMDSAAIAHTTTARENDAVSIANLDKPDDLDNDHLDNLPAALKSYLKTPEQRQAEKEELKANSRLRWLAFYYLSRREHSAGELRQKLIDKAQDPTKIDELLTEFKEKGYQSDYRTAMMLIREGIRKHHGRVRIKNDLYKRRVAMPSNVDELIDMAMADNAGFADVVSEHALIDGVDWLRLAVAARVKKYGEAIPADPKEKARQLRFLQYRGFKPDICFAAITHTLGTLAERF